jgi:hypothetical protein
VALGVEGDLGAALLFFGREGDGGLSERDSEFVEFGLGLFGGGRPGPAGDELTVGLCESLGVAAGAAKFGDTKPGFFGARRAGGFGQEVEPGLLGIFGRGTVFGFGANAEGEAGDGFSGFDLFGPRDGVGVAGQEGVGLGGESGAVASQRGIGFGEISEEGRGAGVVSGAGEGDTGGEAKAEGVISRSFVGEFE